MPVSQRPLRDRELGADVARLCCFSLMPARNISRNDIKRRQKTKFIKIGEKMEDSEDDRMRYFFEAIGVVSG